MSAFTNAVGKMVFWILQWIYSKILSVVCCGAPRTVPTMKNSILMESASSLAARIRNQKVTSVEVVQSYIERIQEINDVLNCVVDERFEEALTEAKKTDELIRSGAKTAKELESETPFLGVPFTAPESVAVKGLSNTMGSWSRRNARADADADVVVLMREGGAIPLACTNVSESCFSYETNNPVFGRTNNPYDTNRSAGGPFGGEACLIASSGSPLGVAPSVRLTSAFNGIFGHKPSAGTSCGFAGPMSRSAADLLPALKLLTKNSNIDLNLDEEVDVKRLKYYFAEEINGRMSSSMPVNEETKEAIKKATDHFKNSHKASVAKVSLQQMKASSIWKARANRLRRVKKLGEINLKKELVKALFGKSQHTFIFLLTVFLEKSIFLSFTSEKNNEEQSLLLTEFQNLLGSDGVFICPTQPTPAFRHNESLVRGFDLSSEAIFDILGLPATHCPAGLNSEGLPVGFQVVAAMNQDRLAIAVAREIDKVFGGWKPPPTHGTFTLKNTVFHNLSNEKVKTFEIVKSVRLVERQKSCRGFEEEVSRSPLRKS